MTGIARIAPTVACSTLIASSLCHKALQTVTVPQGSVTEDGGAVGIAESAGADSDGCCLRLSLGLDGRSASVSSCTGLYKHARLALAVSRALQLRHERRFSSPESARDGRALAVAPGRRREAREQAQDVPVLARRCARPSPLLARRPQPLTTSFGRLFLVFTASRRCCELGSSMHPCVLYPSIERATLCKRQPLTCSSSSADPLDLAKVYVQARRAPD